MCPGSNKQGTVTKTTILLLLWNCMGMISTESTILVYFLVDFNLDFLPLETTLSFERRSYYG